MVKVVVCVCGFLLLFPCASLADNWLKVVGSDDYYYGVGRGQTVDEASKQAMAFLVEMIATHVSSEFTGLLEQNTMGQEVSSKMKVQSCIHSYAQSSLTNVKQMVHGKEPNVEVLRYIRRSDLMTIYADRIAKAKDMMRIAEKALESLRLDMALEHYYWAYSLIRSVQRPSEVKDDAGNVLINWLPYRIEQLLSDIDVQFDGRDEDRVNLLFRYGGKNISCLEFTYSDGRSDITGRVMDGRSMIEMEPGYDTNVYHLNIEYEYLTQTRGDAEMESVLRVIPRRTFKGAEKSVGTLATPVAAEQKADSVVSPVQEQAAPQPAASQLVANAAVQADVIGKVVEAIREHRYSDVHNLFTLDGLSMYRELIAYGTARIVGTPQLQFFRSANGTTVVRGLQMSFSFRRGTKTTFVENVVFTLDADNMISNVAFGLGEVAEKDILCKFAPGWTDEIRELIMEFMENYKTAYCLKRKDYIRDIFADDAVIIVGNIVKRKTPQLNDIDRRAISQEGQEVIHYNRYTKDQYLRNLERCFARNEFINLRFSQSEVQWLEQYKNKEYFAIQIGQEYNSTTYADKGHLFLLVDMSDHNAPQIKIRTWQPHEVAMEKLYNAGDFYNE